MKYFLILVALLIVAKLIVLLWQAVRDRPFNVAGDPEDQSHDSHRHINALRDDTW